MILKLYKGYVRNYMYAIKNGEYLPSLHDCWLVKAANLVL